MFPDFMRLPQDGELLDVGCGTGSLAAELARRVLGRKVVGMDVAEPYLVFARKHHARPGLRFARNTAKLPFGDGVLAGSLAQLLLTFVPDPERVVGEMACVIHPGGGVGAAVWDFCAASLLGYRRGP
jgi:ubiquinone/menaquinone biosynthesis C-methylase UbiE